jgi:phosphoribosyl 1,2-cyclic phosphodiesterase
MRFCSLGSGSSGNATVVEAGSGATRTALLVDCGFTLRELEARMLRADVAPEEISAVFVTHEHGDHVGCAVAFARRHGVPLWMSRGTWTAIGAPDLDGLLRIARDGEAIAVGMLELRPFTVPHDAREPLQLRCSDGAKTLGLLTDCGSVTPHVLAHLERCEALLIECNHDRGMLAASSYPASLKARIGGSHGHLANEAAAQILEASVHGALRHIVAAHLSEQNNRPARARAALAAACRGRPEDIVVADPLLGSGWLALD